MNFIDLIRSIFRKYIDVLKNVQSMRRYRIAKKDKERTCCSKAALVTSTSCDRSGAAVARRTSHFDLQDIVGIC